MPPRWRQESVDCEGALSELRLLLAGDVMTGRSMD
jgi:hypothetical protein